MSSESGTNQVHHEQGQKGGMSYWRFGAMIATAVVVMYGVMYIDSYALDHLTWSESRLYMSLTMGGTMALVMFG